MRILTRLVGVNPNKLDNLDYVKKELKARFVHRFKDYIENKLTDENITYYLDTIEEDVLVAFVDFDLIISKKHNDIELVFNKANSKKSIKIKELKK